jgi:hypothetical protein
MPLSVRVSRDMISTAGSHVIQHVCRLGLSVHLMWSERGIRIGSFFTPSWTLPFVSSRYTRVVLHPSEGPGRSPTGLPSWWCSTSVIFDRRIARIIHVINRPERHRQRGYRLALPDQLRGGNGVHVDPHPTSLCDGVKFSLQASPSSSEDLSLPRVASGAARGVQQTAAAERKGLACGGCSEPRWRQSEPVASGFQLDNGSQPCGH